MFSSNQKRGGQTGKGNVKLSAAAWSCHERTRKFGVGPHGAAVVWPGALRRGPVNRPRPSRDTGGLLLRIRPDALAHPSQERLAMRHTGGTNETGERRGVKPGLQGEFMKFGFTRRR